MNYISVNKGSLINSQKRVYVPGVSYKDIDGWVKTAKDPITYPPDDGAENPIIIK